MATHIALGPARRWSSCAPHASAAAVPSGRGSTRTFSSGTSLVTERIAGAMSRLVRMSTRSGGSSAGVARPSLRSASAPRPARAAVWAGPAWKAARSASRCRPRTPRPRVPHPFPARRTPPAAPRVTCLRRSPGGPPVGGTPGTCIAGKPRRGDAAVPRLRSRSTQDEDADCRHQPHQEHPRQGVPEPPAVGDARFEQHREHRAVGRIDRDPTSRRRLGTPVPRCRG